MVSFNTHFIAQNKAPQDCGFLEVYRGDEPVGRISLGGIAMPALGEKRYSFGVLADVHLTNSSASLSKLRCALDGLVHRENAAFICIAGDLTDSGTAAQFASYRAAVAAYSPGVPVYAVTGEHDCSDASPSPFLTRESTFPYTGGALYDTFTRGEDVFILLGMSGHGGGQTPCFTQQALDFLADTLQGSRGRRCFVIEHAPRFDGSGKVAGCPDPTDDLLSGADGAALTSLLSQYENVIWLHGHTHMSFSCQSQCAHLNYDRLHGCHSVHIPSLAEGCMPTSDGNGYICDADGSFGYTVDVYDHHIVLRGCDFAAGKLVPMAQFCIAVG